MSSTPIEGTHFTTSPSATRRLAKRFASQLRAGDTVSLVGQLGAGKTEFVRGIASAWGVEKSVASPSFVRVHAYGGTPPLFHADFYLAKSEEDASDYGLDELTTQNGIVLVEWGERFQHLLPKNCWIVTITLDLTVRSGRRIEILRP